MADKYVMGLGFGSKEAFYKDVTTVRVQISLGDWRAIISTLSDIFGPEKLKNKQLLEMTWNAKGDYEFLIVLSDSFGRNETLTVPVSPPDETTLKLRKLLYEVKYPMNRYWVLSFSLSSAGEKAGLLEVSSKPK